MLYKRHAPAAVKYLREHDLMCIGVILAATDCLRLDGVGGAERE